MARKAKVITTAVKLGTKYGPQIWVASKALREPAKEAAHKIIASEKARKSALSHARSLSGGSILKVYVGEHAHWVVFTGDTAVSVYPAANVQLATLLTGSDLTKRIRPTDKVSPAERAKDAAATALRRGKPNAIN